MSERPILFAGRLVRAILAGTKTQTRRVVRPQPEWLPEVRSTRGGGPFFWPIGGLGQQCGGPITKLTYGVPGDRLWVREGFGFTAAIPVSAHERCLADRFAPDGWMAYRADEPAGIWCWRSSIHMPRWASRLTLEVTEVRVQRLQDITEEDAIAEGSPGVHNAERDLDAVDQFKAGWDALNAKRASWSSNPWVWVIEFRRAA